MSYPTTRDHIPSAVEANLRKAYIDGCEGVPKYFAEIYNCDNMNQKVVRDAVYAGYGTYSQLDEGNNPDYDSMQEAWNQAYTAKEFALGIQVTRVALQDDLHGVIRQMTRQGGELAEVAAYTMERDAMDLFNSYLTSGTVYTANSANYSLLSTSHYRADGGTWSNRPANDMDLSIEALEFMVGHWMVNQVNQRGQVTMHKPELLMVGAADWALAERLTEPGRRPTSNDNDKNVIAGVIKRVIAHPLLTNDGRWIVRGPKEKTGLNHFMRRKPNVERWPDGDNGNLRMVGLYREVHGATHVRHIWGSA